MQAKQPRSDRLYMTTLDTGRCSQHVYACKTYVGILGVSKNQEPQHKRPSSRAPMARTPTKRGLQFMETAVQGNTSIDDNNSANTNNDNTVCIHALVYLVRPMSRRTSPCSRQHASESRNGRGVPWK